MSINRVAGGTNRDFSQDEAEALRKDDSTSKSLNDARKTAGQKGNDVMVRGDDRRLEAELEAQEVALQLR